MNAPDPSFRILAVDIGGTGLKAALIDLDGNLVGEPQRVSTPHPCLPVLLVDHISEMAKKFDTEAGPGYQAVSVGFPGILVRGCIESAPTLDTPELQGFDLVGALSQKLQRPVRALNDASMQGFGSIEGSGLEMIITLGTGMGSAIFRDGALAVQLELSTHQFRKGETYNQQLGNAALQKLGKKKWSKRVEKAITELRSLTRFDHLYIGGGNAKNLQFQLPEDVKTVPNSNALRGGAQVWRQNTAGSSANTHLDATHRLGEQAPPPAAPAPKRKRPAAKAKSKKAAAKKS
jgi:polyphosphate glucokinase